MAEKFGERFITFGELLLRLAPPNYEKIRMANQFIVTYGGAEANVAVSLSNLGIDSSYFTVVPDSSIGKASIRFCAQTTCTARPVYAQRTAEWAFITWKRASACALQR